MRGDMTSLPLDFIEIAHRLRGRVRVRIPALRRRADELERVARHAADLSGVLDVKGHPFTGSLVVAFDPERVAEERVVTTLRDAAGVRAVLQPGEPRPAPPLRVAPASAAAGENGSPRRPASGGSSRTPRCSAAAPPTSALKRVVVGSPGEEQAHA